MCMWIKAPTRRGTSAGGTRAGGLFFEFDIGSAFRARIPRRSPSLAIEGKFGPESNKFLRSRSLKWMNIPKASTSSRSDGEFLRKRDAVEKMQT